MCYISNRFHNIRAEGLQSHGSMCEMIKKNIPLFICFFGCICLSLQENWLKSKFSSPILGFENACTYKYDDFL